MAKKAMKDKPRSRPDFATIQLSAAGVKMAGGEAGVVRWGNSRRHFVFTASESQEVERSYEWNHLLRNELYMGEPIFEEVPEEDTPALPEPLRTLVDEEPEKGD